MLLHEICPGSETEIELVGAIQYVYDCVFSKGIQTNGYSIGMFKGLTLSIPMGDLTLANLTIKNCNDGKFYRYQGSEVIEVKKGIVSIGSVLDVDYHKVRQVRRYTYDTTGIALHQGKACPMYIIDVSETGIGFYIKGVPIHVGDTIYVKIKNEDRNTVFEKVRAVRVVSREDGLLIGCKSSDNLLVRLGIQDEELGLDVAYYESK